MLRSIWLWKSEGDKGQLKRDSPSVLSFGLSFNAALSPTMQAEPSKLVIEVCKILKASTPGGIRAPMVFMNRDSEGREESLRHMTIFLRVDCEGEIKWSTCGIRSPSQCHCKVRNPGKTCTVSVPLRQDRSDKSKISDIFWSFPWYSRTRTRFAAILNRVQLLDTRPWARLWGRECQGEWVYSTGQGSRGFRPSRSESDREV